MSETSGESAASMPSRGGSDTANRGAPASRRELIKDYLSIVQSLAVTIGFVSGAVWFFAQREALPRATISHSITHRVLTPDSTWVHASIRFTNIGKRAIDLHSGVVWLERILPLEDRLEAQLKEGKPLIAPKQELVEWPRLGEGYTPELNRSFEPGEDEDLEYEFVIPSSIRTVKLYSWFERLHEPRIGWSKSTVYEIGADKKEEMQ
jgi:hypothetical protein